MTSKKSEARLKWWAECTLEEREAVLASLSEGNRKRWAGLTPEERSAQVSKETRAKMSEARRKWWAGLTVEEREAYGAKQRGKTCPQRGSPRQGDQRTDAQKSGDKTRRKGRWVPCDNCGEPVWRVPYQEKHQAHAFCNRDCFQEWYKKQRPENLKTYTCPVCDGEFKRLPSREKYAETMYCSPACAAAARSGEEHPSWKGGRSKHAQGYINIAKSLVPKKFQCMCRKSGKVFEHRLVMAQHLGRPLKATEVVHHKNHIRDDNCLENLELYPRHTHTGITNAERRIAELEKENATLKEQLDALRG